MRHEKCKILLFIDNTPTHCEITLKNVNLQFFPANTTLVLQPMDQEIIDSTKLKFRKLQLQHLVTVMDTRKEKSCSEILMEVNVLEVIYWIKKSWYVVLPDTI